MVVVGHFVQLIKDAVAASSGAGAARGRSLPNPNVPPSHHKKEVVKPSPDELVRRAMKQFAAVFPLDDEQKKNLEAGLWGVAAAGRTPNMQDVFNTVQKVAPIAYSLATDPFSQFANKVISMVPTSDIAVPQTPQLAASSGLIPA